MDISEALSLSASGMDAQTSRLQAIAEDLSQGNTVASAPGCVTGAYRRDGVMRAACPSTDASMRGGTCVPNLGGLNLNALETTRGLLARTIELLG